jgi:hypothetical protein
LPKSRAIFGLALPNGKNPPSECGQGRHGRRIALAIAGDLGLPEFEARLGQAADFAAVAMPETSVNENYLVAGGKTQIGIAGEVFAVKPEAESGCMGEAAHK